MTSRDFCYWLQGYFEIAKIGDEPLALTAAQYDCIQKHLNLVFHHEIDPSFGPIKQQADLNKIHNDNIFNRPDVKIRC